MSNHKLLDHDHSELDNILSDFFLALDSLDVARAIENLDLFWARLAIHIRAEHLHLFPALFTIPDSTSPDRNPPSINDIQSATDKLRKEHDVFMTDVFSALKLLKAIPKDACTHTDLLPIRKKISILAELLHRHNEHEETQVYRWADSFIPHEELKKLNSAMLAELNNLPPRFRS